MSIKTQSGFSIVPALFLIIVLAGLGAAAVRVSMVQQQTVVLAMQSARAFSAARSGLEWAAYDALNNASCGSGSLTYGEGGLTGFNVSTSCSATTHTEGPLTVNVYTINAFAWSGAYGQPDYVSRRVSMTVTDAT